MFRVQDSCVLHVIPIWLPQTQTWLYGQVWGLEQLGCEVHVVCERTENLEQFGINNLHALTDSPQRRQVWDRVARYLGLRRHLEHVIRIGNAVGPKIVHSHFGDIGWGNVSAVERLRSRHVVSFYGYDATLLPATGPRWRRRYVELFAKVDLVLAEGPFFAETIHRLGCPREKLRVHRLGIAVDSIPFEARRWSPPTPLRILLAGRFTEKKGFTYALRAAAELRRVARINVELTIVGDADSRKREQLLEKQRILDTIRRYDLQSDVKLLGFQSQQDLMREAYRSHIFLSPSVTAANGDSEGGAPVAIIEMAASGMPIVTTLHCDIPAVLEAQEPILFSPERDVEGILQSLTWLVDNPEKWEKMLRSVRATIAERHSYAGQARSLAAIYGELLDSN